MQAAGDFNGVASHNVLKSNAMCPVPHGEHPSSSTASVVTKVKSG